MKTSKKSQLDCLFKVSALTLALLAASTIGTRAADINWNGPTASYNTSGDWVGGVVPGIFDSAINDNGLGNAVQINIGDPDWTVGQIRAGNSAGDGAFVQNGQTVTALGTNYNGPVITEFVTPFRLGIVAADTGTYTLNGGSLNYGSGPFTVGAVGTGLLNINGGSIAGSGVFAINYGGISTPNPVVLTATAGHGPYLGDYTYFEQGYYTPNSLIGLPAAGSTVVSIGSPDHSYTLAPTYTAPNAVIVDAAVPNATVTLGTPTVCSGLSFMCSCGNGPVNVNYTVNHSSGTAETGTLVVQDWFFPQTLQPTNEVLAANGRCDGLGRNVQVTGNVAGYTANPPYMWSLDIPVTNPNAVTSISLTFVSGGGTYATATILGVSAQTVAAGPFAPLAITGYNYDVVVENGAPSPNVSPSITDIANQTGGAVNVSGELWVGNGGVGIYNFTNGSINASNWVNVGRAGGTGTLNMAGGTINKSGSAYVVGANAGNSIAGAVGTVNQSGGTINSSSEVWIGQANNNPGLGTGTYNLSGTAALNVTNWLAIGREGGIGVLNLSGGSITKTGGGNLTMTHGTGASGTINQTGGSFTIASGEAWIGEDGGNATWNMNGGTANVGLVHISQNASANGTLSINGGTFAATELTTGNSGAVSTLNLNGGVVQAKGNNLNFLHDIFIVQLQSGGAKFDTAGFNITIPEALPTNGDGSGGLTKSGAGTLTLSGANTYSGPTVVSAGNLVIDTANATGAGDYTVGDGADLNLTVASANAQLNVANLTLGASTGAMLDINLGAFGNPVSAPINVANSLAINGVTTVNLGDTLPQIGQFPLIKYGTASGAGSFAVGSIPVGVGAYISNNVLAASIDLVITNVNLPRWEGLAGGSWDIGVTTNWLNIGDGLPTVFGQGNVVTFNDSALGTTTVNLTATVNPGGITVNNNSLLYTLVGPGKISGNVGITKQGASSLTIANTGGNDFTGPVIISGGTVSVTNLANGGSPSAIGASSAGPTNLVLTGGTLSYAGPAVAINRGYALQGATNSSISTVSNLTLSGLVTAEAGSSFTKSGSAQLAYTTAGNNGLAGGNYLVRDGSVVIDGSAGVQTNTVLGTFSVAGDTGATATLTNTTLNVNDNAVGNVPSSIGSMTMSSNSTLNVNSWFTLGDSANSVSTFNLNGGTLNVPNGRLFLNSAPGTMATLNINGGVINKKTGDITCIADGAWNGSGARTGVVNQVAGTCIFNTDVQVANAPLATAIYNFHGGVINSTNEWFVIGRAGGNGTFNMDGGTLTHISGGQPAFIVGSGAGAGGLNSVGVLNQSAGTINCSSEYWIAENSTTEGTNNISGTAVINLANWMSIGRGGHGVVNFSGGTFNKTGGGNFIVGDGGTGYMNHSGGTLTSANELWVGQGGPTSRYDLSGTGTITVNNWVAIGRGANGVFNMSGGSLTKTGDGGNHLLIGAGHDGVLNQTGGTVTSVLSETRIADGPTGTWNLSGGSAILSVLHISQGNGNVGTLNLNGGSLTATEVTMGNAGGKGTLNFNGGTLIAGSGANANFLHDLATNYVQSGGAVIDSGANTISISQPLLDGGGAGGLVKTGGGTLYLNGANTYTGPTVVSNGTLGGTGSIAGSVTVAAGASLAPGASIGTLTVGGSVSLASTSTSVMEVNKSSGTNDVLSVGGTLTLGGTLVLKNLGGALAVNDTFHLFAAGSFGAPTFSGVQSITPGQTVTWDISNVKVDGTVKVASAVNVPVAITPVASGGNLTLTWPLNQTGWTLQMQTNSLAVGLSTNWVAVPGSTTTNQVTLPIIPAPLSGFFRLVF